jgi:dolichol-phosphate mannosyltransferase
MKTSSEGGLRIAVVVPAHNEAGNILSLLGSVRENISGLHAKFTVFIINDASTDGTVKVVRKAISMFGDMDIALLNKKQSTGIGGVYIFAFKKILNRDFDYVLQMDADLQHNPKYIKDFVRAAEKGARMVASSRYIKHGVWADQSFFRKTLSRYGNVFIRVFLGKRFTDWTGGYNLYQVTVLRKIDFKKMSHDFCFQLELKNAVSNITDKTTEIPIVFRERKNGVSKMKRSMATKTCVSVLKLWRQNGLRFGEAHET